MSMMNRLLLLKRSLTGLVAFVLLGCLHGMVVAGAVDPAALPSIATIKQPPPPLPDGELTVRFQAVAVARHREAGMLYVQDETAGICLLAHPSLTGVDQGERLEIEGERQVQAGMVVVAPVRVQRMGSAALPVPVPATGQSLLEPRLEGSRVTVEGLVSVAVRDDRYPTGPIVLMLQTSDGTVLASAWDRGRDEWLLGQPGSRVRLSGVSTPMANPRGQVMQAGMLVTPRDEIEVTVQAPGKLDAFTPIPIGDLLYSSRDQGGNKLQRIDGVVTAVLSLHAMVVQDASSEAIVVRMVRPAVVQPGQRVALLGQAKAEFIAGAPDGLERMPVIFTALEKQATGSEPLPKPLPVSAATIGVGSHHLRRVSLPGIVLRATRSREPGTFEISLQLENRWIAARGRGLPAETRLPATGSRIQVQGVLDQRAWPDSDDSALRIHLAGPSDWLLLTPPPRDYTRPLLWGISLIAIAASLTLVWAISLRLTVRKRTKELAQTNHDLSHANVELVRVTSAKSLFLATMSHEVRTPMHAVLGFVQILQREPLSGEHQEILERIATAGRSLLRILNDILDFSKIEAGRVALENHAFQLPSVLNRLDTLFEGVARNRGLDWHVKPAPPLSGHLVGDPGRLEQILSNFASNALKFTEHGGVTVETSLITDTPSEARVRFAVQDTSPGIAPEIAATLFQPFTQADPSIRRRHGGTGLGLAICKFLTTAMGGTLGVKSTPGHGSTFWVELPFPRTSEAETADRPAETADPENQASPAGPMYSAHSVHSVHDEVHPVAEEEPAGEAPRLWECSVLVVDDQPINLELAGWVLRQQGAIPTLMSDAREALERLREEPDRFDAVLMDGQMPVLSGWEAIRIIRSHPRLQQLPVIAFTAAVLPSEQKAAREAGANDFVPKPVDVERLVAVLQRWIRPSAVAAAASATSGGAAAAPAQLAAGDTHPFPRVAGLNTEHAAQRLRHDADWFHSLLATFRQEFAPLTAQLHDDVQHGRYDKASSRLHALLGIAGSLGAIELAQTARDLQTALHTKEATHITVPMARFTATLNTLLCTLSEY
jgi:signal transduction histidine kinase/CheY-like chemotaxis protein/HPt (histidine-containing phosphotransfer) domain-containing protein